MHVYRSSNEEMIPQYAATIAYMVYVCSCANLGHNIGQGAYFIFIRGD